LPLFFGRVMKWRMAHSNDKQGPKSQTKGHLASLFVRSGGQNSKRLASLIFFMHDFPLPVAGLAKNVPPSARHTRPLILQQHFVIVHLPILAFEKDAFGFCFTFYF